MNINIFNLIFQMKVKNKTENLYEYLTKARKLKV